MNAYNDYNLYMKVLKYTKMLTVHGTIGFTQ